MSVELEAFFSSSAAFRNQAMVFHSQLPARLFTTFSLLFTTFSLEITKIKKTLVRGGEGNGGREVGGGRPTSE